ncbi:iron-sulfur cluster assembly enzyme ISCU [Erythrolamprus reginae]|uniref:iron-sulfur cluster assembly enzyme ISCU n=1 Tax=Erythrolamprus reginae TaxID=121349 RepID=UPI00396C4B23
MEACLRFPAQQRRKEIPARQSERLSSLLDGQVGGAWLRGSAPSPCRALMASRSPRPTLLLILRAYPRPLLATAQWLRKGTKMAALRASGVRVAALLRPGLARPPPPPAAGYHEKVVDHYENPRNVGSLDKKAKNVGTGLVGAPACGDVMKLQVEVDENGKIVDARFKTFGCGSAIASSSLATEWVKGKTVDEALKIKNTDIAKELCLPPVKLHCSMLAEDAIKAALADYKLKQGPNSNGPEKSAASM